MRKLTSRIAAALLAASMIFSLAGCSEGVTSSSESISSSAVESAVESTPEPTEAPTITPTSVPTATPEPTPEPVKVILADIPAYSGEPYVAINGNVPYFSDAEMTTTSFEDYSPLDSLGRCGCLLYTSPSPRDDWLSRMPSSA